MSNGNEKKARVAIIILDKIDFKTKTVTRGKKRTLRNDKRSNPTRGYDNRIFMHSTWEHLNT